MAQSFDESMHAGEPNRGRSNASIVGVTGITEAGLVLGSGTRLVRMRRDGLGLALDVDRDRLLALLTVASGRSVSADVLRPIEAASNDWRRGDKALANLRLAFARLPQIAAPTDADRLRLAEHLLDEGMPPGALMKALDFDPAVSGIEKYIYDQPRVPAGHGRESGRWAGRDVEVVAADDSLPGAKKPLEARDLPGESEPAKEHPHYIPIIRFKAPACPMASAPDFRPLRNTGGTRTTPVNFSAKRHQLSRSTVRVSHMWDEGSGNAKRQFRRGPPATDSHESGRWRAILSTPLLEL